MAKQSHLSCALSSLILSDPGPINLLLISASLGPYWLSSPIFPCSFSRSSHYGDIPFSNYFPTFPYLFSTVKAIGSSQTKPQLILRQRSTHSLRLCLKKFVGYIRNRRQKVRAAEAAGSGGSSWGSKSRVVHNATGSFNWQTGATRHQHHHHFQQQHHHHIQQHHHQHHQHYHHNRHQTTSIILIFVCLVNSKPNEKKNLQSSNY